MTPKSHTLIRRISATTKLSVVIPCFNEEKVLPLLRERLTKAADAWGIDYEIVLVDDGSQDATWDALTQIQDSEPRWKLIRLARNFGHQIAVWVGLGACTGDVILILDADLQDPPEIVPQFLEKWIEGFDVIYGVRRRRKEGLFKTLAYHAYYRVLYSMAEIDIPLDSGDFCLMDRRVLTAILATREQVPFVRGLRAWVGFRQTPLEYERSARAAGESKYTLRKLMDLAFNGIFSFSTRPLRISTWLGFIVSIVAFAGGVFTLIQRVFAEQFAQIGLAPVPGFATIVISILFLGGVQLICLGILGEYVGRIYQNVKGRPLATVSETIGFTERVVVPGVSEFGSGS